MIPYTPPAFNLDGFNCPHCNAYANQLWQRTAYLNSNWQELHDLKRAYCPRCQNYSLWLFKNMIYPEDPGIKLPNPDLDEEIKDDYNEARSIANKSPRGAAALLRLCIQKLCKQLGESGDKINDDIAELVKKGLPAKVQQSLDIVRVVGNNSVHPGQIDIKDDRETAMKLFELINLIAEVMITQPKHVEELYKSVLPESSREAIEKRDER